MNRRNFFTGILSSIGFLGFSKLIPKTAVAKPEYNLYKWDKEKFIGRIWRKQDFIGTVYEKFFSNEAGSVKIFEINMRISPNAHPNLYTVKDETGIYVYNREQIIDKVFLHIQSILFVKQKKHINSFYATNVLIGDDFTPFFKFYVEYFA